MNQPRRRLRGSEQQALTEAVTAAHEDIAEALLTLIRVGNERVLPAVPDEARNEARRAWMSYVGDAVYYGTSLNIESEPGGAQFMADLEARAGVSGSDEPGEGQPTGNARIPTQSSGSAR